jgi:membrane fusion protein (multidrug efflux system)
MRAKLLQILAGLVTVAVCGLLIAFALGIGGLGSTDSESDESDRVVPPTPVVAKEISLEPVEIIDSYSGMIHPMERFSLGFEIVGRVETLGADEAARPWDEGDRVTEGDVLARLDDRVLAARLKEAEAELERSQADFNRAEELKRRQPGAISESEFSQLVAAKKLAQARFDMAEKSLLDATLRSPVTGVISKRMVNAGESVGPQQPVFEILEIDEVLLIVGVPEAFVGQLRLDQTARVELFARDRFGRRQPAIDGRVYRVAEAADDSTGLFGVEVLVDNRQWRLKPGQIGVAHIVVDRIQGFRVPVTSAVFRGDRTLLFAVGEDDKAHSYPLSHWIEQGPDLILSELPPEYRRVVVRGQHRLVDGRSVALVGWDKDVPAEREPDTTVRTAAAERS